MCLIDDSKKNNYVYFYIKDIMLGNLQKTVTIVSNMIMTGYDNQKLSELYI